MPCDAEFTTAPTVVTIDGRVVTDGITPGHVPHWSTCDSPKQFRREHEDSQQITIEMPTTDD